MKLSFLDIDRVLATEYGSWNPPHELYAYPFNPKCVRILNEILETTNAEIVLSSDWRLRYDLKLLDELFKYNGLIRSPIDITPIIGRVKEKETKDYLRQFNKNREKEIHRYIQQNSNKINRFVILDDADLKIYPNQFVKCNISEGLIQAGIKEQVISIL